MGALFELKDTPPPGGKYTKNRSDGNLTENGTYNTAYLPDNEKEGQTPTYDSPAIQDGGTDVTQRQPRANVFMRAVGTAQKTISNQWKKHGTRVVFLIQILLILGYFAYFAYAMYYEQLDNEASVRLLWCTCVVVVFWLIYLVKKKLGENITNQMSVCAGIMKHHNEKISWIVVLAVFLAFIIFVIVDVVEGSGTPYNLVSVAGIVTYVLLMFFCSYSPAQVKWRPVAWGLGLQFILALIILRWSVGYNAFKWLGDRVTEFLDHADAGALFLFGENYMDHFFAFKVLPVVVFFSSVVSILYYLGWMQVLIGKIAFVMEYTMATTAAESLNAAANIFVGQTEAPLMIQPLIAGMTKSELHAVMTGGMATIAGGVMAAYISFGVPANHLLSASVMSAPAALAMAKLFYPETEVTASREQTTDVANTRKGQERNLIDAASSGASRSIALVANIAVNLIAFISFLHFFNATLTWFGHRVGIEKLTFEFICSYVLFPLALVMGVNVDDCRHVAEMIGIKTFLNEFVAYDRLRVFLDNRELLDAHVAAGGEWYEQGGDIFLQGTNTTLVDGVLTERSEVIATYALCGFANFSSMGILLGGMTPMAPERRQDLSSVALRAMIAGNVACFLTACIAGALFQETA